MEKLKNKAEHLHAVVHELSGKNGPLERASLQELDRLMESHQYESAIAWSESYVQIEGARQLQMSPHNPNSLLAQRPSSTAKSTDMAGQTTIFANCGDE